MEGALLGAGTRHRGGIERHQQIWIPVQDRQRVSHLRIDCQAHRAGIELDRHRRGVERLYQKIKAKGDIYKDAYRGWYCTPCESFYPESQIVGGRCPDQGHKVEWTEEESYFFRLSKYQEPLLKHYAEHRDFVFPE